jgi:aminomethyltransferase
MSAQSTEALLRKSPLDSVHRSLGARMVPFAGWEMPLEYSGITSEHLAVRSKAGLFDASHMGQLEVAGRNALTLLQTISCNDASRLATGQAQYSGLLTPEGTFIDDVLVYRMGPTHFLLVVNAANTAQDYTWIADQAGRLEDVAVVDASSRYALIALQGPASAGVLRELTAAPVEELGYYRFTYGEVANARALISRTGYTGEDGFEVYVPPAMAARVWQALLDTGRSAGVVPCGLGARDTLRLEAGMRLYGNDIDETTTPLEAGLGWIIGWDKPAFNGRARLLEQKEHGVERQLVGFELLDAGVARNGHPIIVDEGRQVGVVTSGTRTPSLRKSIGLAYVPRELASPGSELHIDIRGRQARAVVCALPFYRRPPSR